MATVDVIMPQMGESITEGTLVKWLKKAGDAVTRDEPLFEISTEKVDVEIPAPASGVLKQIKVKEGETVPVNTVVAVLEKGGAGAQAEAPQAQAQPKPQAKPEAQPQPQAKPEAQPKPEAQAQPQAQPDAEPESETEAETEADAEEAEEVAEAGEGRRIRSSPLVRKMAREHQVDLAKLSGTGLAGRITRNDMLQHLEARQKAPAGKAAAPAARAAAPRPLAARVEPMSVMRKKIAEHMVHSRHVSAHVQTVFEMDMSKVVKLREKHGRAFEEQHGVKLTYTAILASHVVRALQEFPLLNASIDGDRIVYHEHVNLGIAVALEAGLIVPVIKAAEEKNVLGLQRAITDLAERARGRKLSPEEVQGGTFTITNPGIFGGLFGMPIINQPQVAILGLGGIEKRPVVIDDAIAIRPMMYMCLSFDHRLIDGAVADQFMASLKKSLAAGEDLG